MTTEVFDITSVRAERAAARAAKREARGDTLELRFGGQHLATLTPEFPLDVLAPLQDINLDLALVVRMFLDLQGAKTDEERAAAVASLVDILATAPDLVRGVIGAVTEMARRLLTEEGYATLCAARPTPWDIGALVKRLIDFYGVGLGESAPSSTSSTDGGTLNTTSGSTAEASTPVTSGAGQATPASWASAAPPP